MKTFAHIVLVFTVLCPSLFAANAVYIGQSAAGGGAGTSCGTQKAYTYFNSSGNWSATPTGVQIGPDTTVHLCGTITGPNTAASTVFTFQGSGTSGHPITLFWEAGATVAPPSCGTKDGGGCIDTGGNTFLILDGNSTANSVTSTANGTAGSYANQTASVGIRAWGCSNCEFKNLAITNIYVMTTHTDMAPAGMSGDPTSLMPSGSNYKIHDNTFDQTRTCIGGGFWNNGDTNIEIYNNTLDHFNFGVNYVNNTVNTLSNIRVHNNHIKNMDTWDSTDVSNPYHHDGMFFDNDSDNTVATATITSIYIYDNIFDGDPGNTMTAWIYYNSGLDGIYVFNNVFLNPTARVPNGVGRAVSAGHCGSAHCDHNFFVYNNFIDCNSPVSGWMGLDFNSVVNLDIKNNGIMRCSVLMSTGTATGTIITTPNVTSASSLGATSVGIPLAGSAMIHDGTTKFTNLTSLCTGNLSSLCTDYAGATRPNVTNGWDAGAYQFGSGGDVTPPTAAITVPANGATISGTSVTITASCVDDTACVGVQFKLDGANLQAEDTSSPYSITLDATFVKDGAHTLSCSARDAVPNIGTCPTINITVDNPPTPKGISGTYTNVGVKIL